MPNVLNHFDLAGKLILILCHETLQDCRLNCRLGCFYPVPDCRELRAGAGSAEDFERLATGRGFAGPDAAAGPADLKSHA